MLGVPVCASAFSPHRCLDIESFAWPSATRCIEKAGFARVLEAQGIMYK